MDTPFTFGYPYRWSQILQMELPEQIACLEERDRALEAFFFSNGSCPLEIPYRWDQVLPGLLEGDPGAIACLEENDRAIEDLFNNCDCGPWTISYGSNSCTHPLTDVVYDLLFTADINFIDADLVGTNSSAVAAYVSLESPDSGTLAGPFLLPSGAFDYTISLTGETASALSFFWKVHDLGGTLLTADVCFTSLTTHMTGEHDNISSFWLTPA